MPVKITFVSSISLSGKENILICPLCPGFPGDFVLGPTCILITHLKERLKVPLSNLGAIYIGPSHIF